MANNDFNVGENVRAPRKLLMTFVNVGTSSDRDWELVGRGVEDSAIELNPETETATDITGITSTAVNKWEPNQTFEPNTVRGGSKLNFKLHQIWQNKTPELLSQFEVMLVYAYIGTDTIFEAEIQSNCTINITSIGGSAYVDMPIEISYSNDSEKGTVSFEDKKPVFTSESAA